MLVFTCDGGPDTLHGLPRTFQDHDAIAVKAGTRPPHTLALQVVILSVWLIE